MKKIALVIMFLSFIFVILTGCGNELPPKETHVDATPLTEEQLQKYFGIKIVE